MLIRGFQEPRRISGFIASISESIATFRESIAIVNICLRGEAFDDTKAA
jgi:hypothetical protein